jgi:uncharacterized protein YbaP (TraB family)
MLASMHALPEVNSILPDDIWSAHKLSRQVVFESDLDYNKEPSFVRLTNSEVLSSYISPELFSSASDLWHSFGRTDSIHSAKPWFAGLVLSVHLTLRSGFNFKFGVDRQLWQSTPTSARLTLEGPEALLAFDKSPLSEQIEYLASIALDPDSVQHSLRRLYGGWIKRDSSVFAKELIARRNQFPIGFGFLIDDRNRTWIPQILHILRSGIPTLFVMGALHFEGESSIHKLMKQHGYDLLKCDCTFT